MGECWIRDRLRLLHTPLRQDEAVRYDGHTSYWCRWVHRS